MSSRGVSFSIAAHAAWAPGIETRDAWLMWADKIFPIAGNVEPPVRAMPPMLRRRAGSLGKMALEVAYQCLGDRTGVPTVFCSRHGEASRSVDMLSDLAQNVLLSPASFSLAVHNATGGLFTIARGDQANNIALAAGSSTIEHAVIEACGLLADGEPAVLLVAYDCPLPSIYSTFEECAEQPHAWAWLMQPAHLIADDVVSLTWSAADEDDVQTGGELPAGLDILRFHLRKERELKRRCGKRQWRWSRDV
jgi:hypothetical protein